MKRFQWIIAQRYMLRQKSACLSMLIVAMLAVTAYLGINDSAAAMRSNAERFWDAAHFRDIEIAAPSLLSEADLRAIAETEGVAEVEPLWYASAAVAGQQNAAVDVVSLTETLNTVILTQGRMPRSTGECLLEQPVLDALGLSVGESIELEGCPALAQTRFTVCGAAQHGDHACVPLHVPGNRYVIVLPGAFDLASLHGGSMKALVRIEGAEGADRFSEDYLRKSELVCRRLNRLAEQRAGRQLSLEDADFLDSVLGLALARLYDIHPWLVLDVWGSSCYYAIRSAAENVAAMGVTFALAFIIVGALVIYASVSRMAEADRAAIGTAKAMGCTGREIAFKYLAAGLVPTAAGMLAGIAAGYAGIQRIVLAIYGQLYVYGSGVPAFRTGMTLAVFAAGLGIAAAAATVACAGILRAPAVKLMNERAAAPRSTARAKRSAGTNLSTKLILRGIRSEKRRIGVIAAGIAGCMVLLVAGFTIKLAVTQSLERQFSDVERYDLKIVFDPAAEHEGTPLRAQIRSVLTGAGLEQGAGQSGWIALYDHGCFFTAGGRMNGGELICAAPEDLAGYLVLTDVSGGGRITPSARPGVYIHLRTAETAGLAPGSRLILHDGSMGQRSVAVSGVFNNYVGGQMVMSEAAYEALFGEKPAQNCFWVKCDALCRAEVVRLLRSLPVTVTESSAKQAEYQSYTAALDVIAALLAGIAALMAGGVLLNLIYLQYYRKKRSLVVMRINGFTAWETLGYVLGESVVTHVIGLLLGIAGGAWLGRRIILLMEARQLHIVRSVQPMAWLISLLIMLLFSFVIHAVIARAVVRLKPTEDVMTR